MWKAVHIASNKSQAEEYREKLASEGVLVKVKAVSCGDDRAYEILVPESEAEDAQSILYPDGGEF